MGFNNQNRMLTYIVMLSSSLLLFKMLCHFFKSNQIACCIYHTALFSLFNCIAAQNQQKSSQTRLKTLCLCRVFCFLLVTRPTSFCTSFLSLHALLFSTWQDAHWVVHQQTSDEDVQAIVRSKLLTPQASKQATLLSS